MDKGFDLKKALDKGWKGFVHFIKKGGWFCLLMFFVDLGTKLWANAYFGNPEKPLHEEIDIIPNVLYLTLVYNTGAAYGAGANMGPAMRIVFACLSFVVGVIIIYFMAKYFDKMSSWMRYGVYLILAGDFGNFIDRAFYWDENGIYGVIDWIGVGNASWPSFLRYVCNWADICLTVGAVIFVISYIVYWYKENNTDGQKVEKKPSEQIGGSYAMAEKMMEEESNKVETPRKKDMEKKLELPRDEASDKHGESSSDSKEEEPDEDSSLSDILKGE